MASPADNPELQRQLAKLQSQTEAVSPNEITAIVESIMSRLAGDLTAADLKLYTELEQLARFIQNARSERNLGRGRQIPRIAHLGPGHCRHRGHRSQQCCQGHEDRNRSESIFSHETLPMVLANHNSIMELSEAIVKGKNEFTGKER